MFVNQLNNQLFQTIFHNFNARNTAQQTVAPDAVTRVFPSVGGYKEFAPTKIYNTDTNLPRRSVLYTRLPHPLHKKPLHETKPTLGRRG
jgi:hypothetical protein